MSGDLRPYALIYKHNKTGARCRVTIWAHSIRDARERFRDCEARQEAERIISVKRDE